MVALLPVMRRMEVREAIQADKVRQNLVSLKQEARADANRRFVERFSGCGGLAPSGRVGAGGLTEWAGGGSGVLPSQGHSSQAKSSQAKSSQLPMLSAGKTSCQCALSAGSSGPAPRALLARANHAATSPWLSQHPSSMPSSAPPGREWVRSRTTSRVVPARSGSAGMGGSGPRPGRAPAS